MDVGEVILKLYWTRTPISGVFCLQGKVSFLHFLDNFLKMKLLKMWTDIGELETNLTETMLNPEVVGELLFRVKVDRAFEWAQQAFLGNGGSWGGEMILHRQEFLNCRVHLTSDNQGQLAAKFPVHCLSVCQFCFSGVTNPSCSAVDHSVAEAVGGPHHKVSIAFFDIQHKMFPAVVLI